MKNLIKGFVLASFAALVLLPSVGSAATASDLQAMINSLMAQVQQLQQQLAQMQNGTTAWCYTFTTNIKIGDSSDVLPLEIALHKEGLGNFQRSGDNSIFTEADASAVTAFQQKYASDILTPNGLKYGTGYVGPSTRAKLNALYGCGVTPTPTPTPITQPSITVISPNGGEQWQVGQTYTISWSSQNAPSGSHVGLALYGPTNSVIKSGLATSGSYSWTVPSTVSTDQTGPMPITSGATYKISASLYSGDCWSPWGGVCPSSNSLAVNKASDTSDNYFSIVAAGTNTQPSITVFSPNGGEQWQVGQTYSIQWNSSGIPNNSQVTIGLLDTRYGDTTGPLGSTVIAQASNSGSYTWTVPQSLGNGGMILGAGNFYKIWIDSYYGQTQQTGAYEGVSANVFSITSNTNQPSVTVLSPNGGEQWQTGTQQTIRWSTQNIPQYSAMMLYLVSPSKGTQLITEGIAAYTGYYNWTATQPASDYKIEARVYPQGTCFNCGDGGTPNQTMMVSDQSDASFSIVSGITSAPTITSLTLDGTSVLLNGVVTEYNAHNPVISWTSSNTSYCTATSRDMAGNATADFTGTKPTSGSQAIMVGDTYYNQRNLTLQCFNSVGASSDVKLAFIGGKG